MQDQFLIAKNEWSAKHIFSKLKKGELDKEKVLFPSHHKALQFLKQLDTKRRNNFNVFKVHI